jgi:Zn-dependent protease with chaperone function
MADEASEIVGRTRVGRARHARLRFVLAGISCAVFIGFLVLLALATREDPLKPLRDVRFSALGVLINFALALGSVVGFGYWRRRERERAAQRGAR